MNHPSANRFRWLNRAMLVIGGRDLEAGAVSMADILAGLRERRA